MIGSTVGGGGLSEPEKEEKGELIITGYNIKNGSTMKLKMKRLINS